MPSVETEERQAPRSALRYRPTHTDQADPGPMITRQRRSRLDRPATAAPVVPDDLDLEEERIPRPRSGAPVPQRPAPRARPRRHFHPLFFIGLGLLMTILLWAGITQALRWGNNELNTLKYGDPRTFQIDQVVGHGDNAQHPSHFVALNLRGTVTIIEFPAGDPGRARVLASTSILGPNADQAVVTLRFVDVNHNGEPDMLINIDGVQSILVNDGSSFRPPTPTEQQQILQHLQQQN